MRGIKLGGSNNSQDSAFSSMTDGELSRASSFKLSSFQSVSSPIDEGVEDFNDVLDSDLLNDDNYLKRINSRSSCSSQSSDINLRDFRDAGPSPLSNASISPSNRTFSGNMKETCIYLEPPKLILNDHAYSQSKLSTPTKKNVDTFSQKYRVLSFEDMTSASQQRCKIDKKPYRSFEEEQRIESAFTPRFQESNHLSISTPISPSVTTIITTATISAPPPSADVISGRERSILWKDSFLKYNKNNITIKSNESIYEDSLDVTTKDEKEELPITEYEETDNLLSRNCSITESDIQVILTESPANRKSRSDKFMFNLAKLKQCNAIGESILLDNLSESSNDHSKSINSSVKLNSNSSSAESNVDQTISTSANDETLSDEEDISSLTESLLRTPSNEVKKFIESVDSDNSGNGEDKPLLEDMELSSLSPS